MAIVHDGFGQLDPGVDAAVIPPPTASLLPFYLIATAAGLTVYFITRMLDKRKR